MAVLKNHCSKGQPVAPPMARDESSAVVRPEPGLVERVLITVTAQSKPRSPQGGLSQLAAGSQASLRPEQAGASAEIEVTVHIGNQLYAVRTYRSLPRNLRPAQSEFFRGFNTETRRDAKSKSGRDAKSKSRRDAKSKSRSLLESNMLALGKALGAMCLPDGSGAALTSLIDGRGIGTVVEVMIEAEGAGLLGLPFEALRLPDGRLLATQPAVVMLRRPRGIIPGDGVPLAGPLKILVAVGAPDEGNSTGPPLDQERELQNILDAVDLAALHENAQVRILEVGHPAQIGSALESDAYHVLHLSCHGQPGQIELEDEDGKVVATTASQLLDPVKEAGRPLPLVFLNACHGGAVNQQTASFAEALLRGGVPAVVAMQTSVTDFYAIQLAAAFYHHLSKREIALPSRALAQARRDLERARLQRIERGAAPLEQTQPEYATATLFVAGEERPLADFAVDKVPLRVQPVYDAPGPIPQLRIDDLVGRRVELRNTLRMLRNPQRQYAGVVLTGIGGVGKSAIAGRVMQRLEEDGWMTAGHVGRFDLAQIATALATALIDRGCEKSRRAEMLARSDLADQLRWSLILKTLAEDRVLLVLDNFEQNLISGGGAFLDPDTARRLGEIAANARRGRLLITSRYPVPDTEGLGGIFSRVSVGPLSPAQTRKLSRRLPSLRGVGLPESSKVLRTIGGHPRMLEFLDALVRGGQGRLSHVTKKLHDLAKLQERDTPERGAGAFAGPHQDRTAQAVDDSPSEAGASPVPAHKTNDTSASPASAIEEQIPAALLLGARDVFLKELLDLARKRGIDQFLLQLAVSNLPVTPAGLARMISEDAGDAVDAKAASDAIVRLEDLSLAHRFADGSAWVHRWTADGLAQVDLASYKSRCIRAGRYREWRVENESHEIADAVEGVRNYLAGEAFDSAAEAAQSCIEGLHSLNQSLALASLASEVLETLPESHPKFAMLADEEAQAHLNLGDSDAAFRRYASLIERHEQRAAADPACPAYQHDLSVSYNHLGDMYRILGEGQLARDNYRKAVSIAERLTAAEPDHSGYQRHLSVSYNRIGDVYRELGHGELARDNYQKALSIVEGLAAAEPDHAGYRHDLSVSYVKIGDWHRARGQGELARDYYFKDLAAALRLAEDEPDRADYRRSLSVSYERLGDLYSALGQGELARDYLQKSIIIREQLAADEPDRVDYQRDLSASYDDMGELYTALGQGELAYDSFQKSLSIAERLAADEPDRADYQRDLFVSYDNLGNLYSSLGQSEPAADNFRKALSIAERLAAAEPDRGDYQRDLSVSHDNLGDFYSMLGQDDLARDSFKKSLTILERLAAAEPDHAGYQRDLSVSHIKMGDLYRALGRVDLAGDNYRKALSIAERLTSAEPARADYQRDLSVCYNKMGYLHSACGDCDLALDCYVKDLAVSEQLARAEPDRTDYQRDLAVVHTEIGGLYRALGKSALARDNLQKALEITERLAGAEPDNADYQRDLSVIYNKMGGLDRMLGQGALARDSFQKALAVIERLAATEPGRADYQRDLIASYVAISEIGDQDRADHLRKALDIAVGLQESGRMRPADEQMIAEIRKRIDAGT